MIYYFTERKKGTPPLCAFFCQFISNVRNDPVTNCRAKFWKLPIVCHLDETTLGIMKFPDSLSFEVGKKAFILQILCFFRECFRRQLLYITAEWKFCVVNCMMRDIGRTGFHRFQYYFSINIFYILNFLLFRLVYGVELVGKPGNTHSRFSLWPV